MKKTIFIVFLTISSFLFGQKPAEKVGEIEVQLIRHFFKRNADYELTKKKTNRKNRPNLRIYFDSNGILLKSISFGKRHNTDLRLIDKIHIYNYDKNGMKSNTDVWETDYDKNISYQYFFKFDLDSTKSRIISEKMYEFESNTIFTQADYLYNEKGEYQGRIFDSTYYYKRKYNDKKRLINLQQIYDSKLRWEWKYTYSDSKRIGIFQTYYNDGEDYSEKEIRTYDKHGRLIEIEELQITKDGMENKIKIFYDKNGVINRIEQYNSYNPKDGYEFVTYQEIKVKTRVIIDSRIAKKINEEILAE